MGARACPVKTMVPLAQALNKRTKERALNFMIYSYAFKNSCTGGGGASPGSGVGGGSSGGGGASQGSGGGGAAREVAKPPRGLGSFIPGTSGTSLSSALSVACAWIAFADGTADTLRLTAAIPAANR